MANRKCTLKSCRSELPSKAESDMWQAKGFCNVECMADHGLSKAREQAERKRKADELGIKKRNSDLKKKVKSEDRGACVKAAQSVFNAYIRARDKGSACISCGRMPNFSAHVGGSGIQAGHYRSVGACPELRFEELNVHIQCVHCNIHKSGNAIDYRIGLIKKIGVEKVEWVEGPHSPKKYSIDELKAIEKTYKAKIKEIAD